MASDAHNVSYNQGGAGNGPDSAVPKKIKAKNVLGYVFLPGILPQVKELTRGGFGYLAFLIALLYQSVRILPNNHPYTRYENIGKFGIRKIIAAAANNVKFNKKNIDQIIVFFAVLTGIIILFLQVFSFLMLVFTGQAFAQGVTPQSFGGIFSTPHPDSDIAFFMLRDVFGVPDMFGTLPNGQTNLHLALQAMIQFYNLAILVVAIIVFIYYVIVVVAETAQTGTPFGQRFSHIYAPLRLVVAIGLLVPLNYGYNGAQYLTFFAAKTGSGFATTGWTQFNNSLTDSNPLGAENATLIAKGKTPDIESVVEFMAMATTCREAYAAKGEGPIQGYVIFDQTGQPTQELDLFVSAYTTMELAGYNKNLKIVFGAGSPDAASDASFQQYPAGIKPYCGSIIVPINLKMDTSFVDDNGFIDVGAGSAGYLQKQHFLMVMSLWRNADLRRLGQGFAEKFNTTNSGVCTIFADDCLPPASFKENIISQTRTTVDTYVLNNYQAARDGLETQIKNETLIRGWGGAGIWYNRIAQMNGAYVVATRNIPEAKKFPWIMEYVLEEKQKTDNKFSGCKVFEPNLAGDKSIIVDEGSSSSEFYANTFNAAYQYWTCDKERKSANFILDAASAIFGLDGLLSIRETVDTFDANGNPVMDANGNPVTIEIHPLAKLSALGKGLIESAIRSMTLALLSSGLAGLLSATQFGGAFGAASSMFVSIATIGLSIGFITYYILPFLPFIYFFFAVGNWVKSIFEAMVGVPLWALAHLRIDGDGLPGKMALNGYLLLLEIFLRPILTVFGLLGGMAIFTALAAIMNEVFDLVVSVGVGVDLTANTDSLISMNIVDVFFFTVVYAVILYMMAVSSFKMINLVPNNILRWLGNSVAAFSDNADDPTQGLVQYAALGGARIGGQLAGGLTQGMQGLTSIPGAGIGAVINSDKTK